MMQKAQQAALPIADEGALATVEAAPQGSLIALALQQGATVEVLEKLVALQERHEADEARKAFHAAMSDFKANPPHISKDKLVSYGQTSYRHATLANVTDKISAELSKHGLSAGWQTAQDGQKITVTCTITHRLGHSESTALSGEPDASGQKNKIQQVGSTVTYLQRYTLLALTGLATHDQDDDGHAADVKLISESVAADILTWITELAIDEGKFLDYLGAQTIEDITEEMLPRVNAIIKRKRREAGK